MFKSIMRIYLHLGVMMYMLHVVSCIDTSTCIEPSARCVAHRKCTFGTEAKYASVLKNVSIMTGCSNCFGQCDAMCVCSDTHSLVQIALQAQQYCEDTICKDPSVQLVMKYTIDNFNVCELQFNRVQKKIIQLCGENNNRCCNGTCTDSYQITQQVSHCNQMTGITAPARWVITVYSIAVIVLAQLAYSIEVRV